MTDTFAFTGSERAYLKEIRALSTDSQGREVLVGLTFDETVFYVTYIREQANDIRSRDDNDKYLELHEKHERARITVLGAENQLQNNSPTRH